MCKACHKDGVASQGQWDNSTESEKIERLQLENKILFHRVAVLHDVLKSIIVLGGFEKDDRKQFLNILSKIHWRR